MKRRTFSLYILMICCGMVRQKLRALPSVFPFRIPISFHTALYVIHQCETSFQNIGIGLLEISGIPGIGDIPGMVGKVEETMNFSFVIAGKNFQNVADIRLFHADDIVVEIIVPGIELFGGPVVTGDSFFGQQLSDRRIDGISELFPAGSLTRRKSLPLRDIAEDEFRHRRTADIAVAHE